MSRNMSHLVVEQGPDKGLEIVIPPDGARAGRSSNNDIVLNDPAMSRFHCRFFFKSGEGLWAEDLGSANKTMLNDRSLRRSRIRSGDSIVMGDTKLRVVGDAPFDSPHTSLFGDAHDGGDDAVGKDVRHNSSRISRGRKWAAVALTALAAASFVITVVWLLSIMRPFDPDPMVADSVSPRLVEITYEKIKAGPDNIFRYEMDLKNNTLSIQIDDLKNNRHVPGTQNKRVDPDLVRNLIDHIERAGFFDMKGEYKGRDAAVWDLMDLSITVGSSTHRVVVRNRIEPDSFKAVRETIEEFGRNELGLAALALSHEALMELAGNAWLVAQSLYDQRQIKHENLASAIRSLKEMDWYIETIEPKPDYYESAIALLGEAERELQDVHDHHLFLANRAIRLREWDEAANQLRILCAKIPDRSDDRHRAARKKLIDVERRLRRD